MSPWTGKYQLAGLAIIAAGLAQAGVGSARAAGSSPAYSFAVPKRIVSLNLCADQYLLALADRAQIAGLTRNAVNEEMSAAAGQARGLPIIKGAAEEILAINPDLVIGAFGRQSSVMTALASERYRLIDLKLTNSYADIVTQMRDVAKAVGHPERGEALIARMDRDLAAISRRPRAGVAAYYQRRGFLTGTGTLIDDLMKRVGLVNLATTLGKPALSQLSLEELMAAKPDYLIIESGSERIVDQGTEMLQHPLLRDIKRLRLPQAWTVCGGPAYVDAARSLAAQLDQAKTKQIGTR